MIFAPTKHSRWNPGVRSQASGCHGCFSAASSQSDRWGEHHGLHTKKGQSQDLEFKAFSEDVPLQLEALFPEHLEDVSLLGAQEKKKRKGHSQTQLTGAFPCVEPKGRGFSCKINFHPSGLQPVFLTWAKGPIQILCSRYRLTNPLDCRRDSYMRGKHVKLILVHLGIT